jgi:hypothetical protein
MWILALFLVLDDGSDSFRYATHETRFATEQQCRAAQAELLERDALPEGYAKQGWRLLTGPECERADDLVS